MDISLTGVTHADAFISRHYVKTTTKKTWCYHRYSLNATTTTITCWHSELSESFTEIIKWEKMGSIRCLQLPGCLKKPKSKNLQCLIYCTIFTYAISNRANASRLAKIPSLSMARTVLPVRNHAFWSKCGTKSVHKINETRNSLVTKPGCSNDYSRRYTCARSNNRYNKSTRTYGYESTRVIRVFDQLEKVNSYSNTENPLLGDAHRLDNDGICLTNGKSENIQRECRNLLKTQQPSIRQISRVLGLLER